MLDQLASLFGEPSTALLIDFRDVTVAPVAFDPDGCGVALLLIDSRARHRHVGGDYAARRASCERAAADLAASSLREVQDRGPSVLASDSARVTDPVDARRARHVLTENDRVVDFVAALGDSDFTEAGRIFTASHASMRDDFEITTEHIDLIADTAVARGRAGRADDRRRLRGLCDRPGADRPSGCGRRGGATGRVRCRFSTAGDHPHPCGRGRGAGVR